MLAAPLMAGNDLRSMNQETKEILTNKEVIAVNQDSLGNQARRFMDMGDHEIWAKELSNGETAICFLNRGESSWKLNYDWEKNTIYYMQSININKKEYSIRDLWQHKSIGTTRTKLIMELPAHGSLLVHLTPKNRKTDDTN